MGVLFSSFFLLTRLPWESCCVTYPALGDESSTVSVTVASDTRFALCDTAGVWEMGVVASVVTSCCGVLSVSAHCSQLFFHCYAWRIRQRVSKSGTQRFIAVPRNMSDTEVINTVTECIVRIHLLFFRGLGSSV